MYTANAFIVTDMTDNQIAGFYPGALDHADILHVADVKESIALALISPDKPEAMVQFARECANRSIPYIFDPAQQLPRLTKTDLLTGIRGAIGLIGNDYEIDLFLDRCSITKKTLFKQMQFIATTKGSEGSLIETSEESIAISAVKPERVVDPTGAGDAYRAGLLWALKQGFPLKKAGNVGSLAATYAVERQGTQQHRFTKKSFAKRFYQCYNVEI